MIPKASLFYAMPFYDKYLQKVYNVVNDYGCDKKIISIYLKKEIFNITTFTNVLQSFQILYPVLFTFMIINAMPLVR